MASNLATEAIKWIAEAKTDKQTHQIWHDDFYKFCLPWRRRPSQQSQMQPVHDVDELFDSTAIETNADFAADMQNKFTPSHKSWLGVEPAKTLSGPELAQLKNPLKAYSEAVFSEIRRSNFNEAAQESYLDLAAGTMAICIQNLNINEPIQCQAVSITDLLIVRGIYGGVDFKARVLSVKYKDLKTTYPNAKWPAALQNKMSGNDAANRADVKECFWRLYTQPGVERWQYCLLVDNEEADAEIYEGRGSCSLIVSRWRTDSTTAWGVGPMYTILPEVKTLDQLKYLLLKQGNLAVDPIVAYDDDQTINVESGLQPGQWVAKAVGSEIKVIESESKFDVGFFQAADMQANIRSALFQDKPDQKGKTPPTATQVLYEDAQIDVRMGSPVGRSVSEWQIPIFERFAFIMQNRGRLPEVMLKSEAIEVRPTSPLQKAHENEEVLQTDRLLEIIGLRFGPEAVATLVKMPQTVMGIKEKMGESIAEIRTEEEIAQLVADAAEAAAATGAMPEQ